MSRTFKIAIAAIAISMGFAPAALAQPDLQSVSVNVSYSDLDISKPEGGATLLKRIEGAARRACSSEMAHSPLIKTSPMKCRRDAVANAVRSAGIETLTLAWNGKNPATRMASR